MKSSVRQFKNAAYRHLAQMGKALSSPVRLELLDLLSQAPLTVEALAADIGQSIANTSHHLQILKSARMVVSEQEGTWVWYRLSSEEVEGLVVTLRALAGQKDAELDRVTTDFFSERDGAEVLNVASLRRRMARGPVTLVDVRPRAEFEAGHIPGAIWLPPEDLASQLAELPREQAVVAYCRGPWCVYAADAVRELRAKGYVAHRMEDGLSGWRQAGGEVDVSRDQL